MKSNLQHMDNFEGDIIAERLSSKLRLTYKAKQIIGDNKVFLLGAIGEQKASDELEKLPDSFVVINDFYYRFGHWMHNRKTDEWIKSIQADHLVIGPTGIFVIETKNWSKASIQNIDLRSPVEQIKRTSYALFRLLNGTAQHRSIFHYRNWGTQKISVCSIILMIGPKPEVEFEHVKILSLDNIRLWITRAKPVFDGEQVRELSDLLGARE